MSDVRGYCDCGGEVTQCSSCAVADWQAAHRECAICCPVAPAPRDPADLERLIQQLRERGETVREVLASYKPGVELIPTNRMWVQAQGEALEAAASALEKLRAERDQKQRVIADVLNELDRYKRGAPFHDTTEDELAPLIGRILGIDAHRVQLLRAAEAKLTALETALREARAEHAQCFVHPRGVGDNRCLRCKRFDAALRASAGAEPGGEETL